MGATFGAQMPERLRVDITPSEQVTAIAYDAAPRDRADICLILAPGAGASQTNRFMVHFATTLAARGFDTVTFDFAYVEHGRRIPDRNEKLEACYASVIAAIHARIAHRAAPDKLVIGGKSMGGRIASQVAAVSPDGIAGLVFLGYPLHPPGRPNQLRTRHWPDIRLPMLFVQGSRDPFGTPDELRPLIADLKAPVELCVVEGGDHSFKVPKAAGPQDRVYVFALNAIERWLRSLIA